MPAATGGCASPQLDEKLAALRNLKIDAGRIVSVEREVCPTGMTPDGEVYISDLPPRIIVKMVLNPAKGSNINVEVWLPDADRWNSRFLGVGNGGAAGKIEPPCFAWAAAAGYAVATTDMGTAPNADSGIGNPEVWKDFGFRATHLMTVAAKQAVAEYYGMEPRFSYFFGGSTGGQQGLQEAQRYPEDYDGIVANLAALCRTPLHAYFLWNEQIFAKCPFTKQQEENVIAAGNEYMASHEVPLLAGTVVSDPRYTGDDIEAVVALALKKDPTLTKDHAEALRKLFDGPRHAETGERICSGIPFGGGAFEFAVGNLYPFRWVFGPEKDPMEINFGKDIDTYTATLGPYLNAMNPDLSRFAQRGGKILLMLGSSDACVLYHMAVDYYERVIKHFGSLEEVRSFFRFFIVPGMKHGPSPAVTNVDDPLGALVAWREKGEVLEVLNGRRIVDDKTVWTLPLYSYPSKAVWDAEANAIKPIDGPRGGLEPIADRFLPAPAQ